MQKKGILTLRIIFSAAGKLNSRAVKLKFHALFCSAYLYSLLTRTLSLTEIPVNLLYPSLLKKLLDYLNTSLPGHP